MRKKKDRKKQTDLKNVSKFLLVVAHSEAVQHLVLFEAIGAGVLFGSALQLAASTDFPREHHGCSELSRIRPFINITK